MEQRTLRLGDIVDDYCPRERRLTNHAIAVMIGTDIHTTRCTTCDTDHPYKHGKLPAKKARAEPAVAHESPANLVSPVVSVGDADVLDSPIAPAAEDAPAAEAPPESAWTHRPLIRAALPKLEGQPPPARPLPEFTMRQPGARGNDFRSQGSRRSQGGGGFSRNRNSRWR